MVWTKTFLICLITQKCLVLILGYCIWLLIIFLAASLRKHLWLLFILKLLKHLSFIIYIWALLRCFHISLILLNTFLSRLLLNLSCCYLKTRLITKLHLVTIIIKLGWLSVNQILIDWFTYIFRYTFMLLTYYFPIHT